MTALEEELPRLPKISLMEQLSMDFSQKDECFQVTTWHTTQLKETEQKLKNGEEHFEDWSEAQRKLRKA